MRKVGKWIDDKVQLQLDRRMEPGALITVTGTNGQVVLPRVLESDPPVLDLRKSPGGVSFMLPRKGTEACYYRLVKH